MTTHVGKIGRLARAVREELGRRIEDGQTGEEMVEWLNGLPETQAMLQQHFGGRAITEQNLSEWRQSGHLEWLRREEARRAAETLTEESDDLDEAGGEVELGERLAKVVAAEMARLAMLLRREETDPRKQWEVLCEVRRELSALRKDDHRAARVVLRQAQWEHALEREEAAAAERRNVLRRERLMNALLMKKDDRLEQMMHRIRFDLPLDDLPEQKDEKKVKAPEDTRRHPNKKEKGAEAGKKKHSHRRNQPPLPECGEPEAVSETQGPDTRHEWTERNR